MTSYCRRWEISFYTLFPLLSSHYSYSKIVFISFRLCTHRSDEVSSALQLHFLIKHSIFPRIKKCPFSFYLLDFFLTYVLLINLQCLWQQKKKKLLSDMSSNCQFIFFSGTHLREPLSPAFVCSSRSSGLSCSCHPGTCFYHHRETSCLSPVLYSKSNSGFTPYLWNTFFLLSKKEWKRGIFS